MTTPSFSHGKQNVRVVIDHRAVERMVNDSNGDVMREMLRRADRLIAAARRQIRHGHVHGGPSGGGSLVPLRDTITKRIERGPNGKNIVVVGSDHPIAKIHHDGTRPHIIEPRVKRVLAFYKPTGGLVITKRVHHPGTHPNRYLTDNLHLIT